MVLARAAAFRVFKAFACSATNKGLFDNSPEYKCKVLANNFCNNCNIRVFGMLYPISNLCIGYYISHMRPFCAIAIFNVEFIAKSLVLFKGQLDKYNANFASELAPVFYYYFQFEIPIYIQPFAYSSRVIQPLLQAWKKNAQNSH